jgi:predicted nucleotidyltransferase
MKLPSFKKYVVLKESVIDIPRDTLDPTVFSFPTNGLPILQSGIKKQILKDIDSIDKIIPVRNFYMIGSILTKRYDKDSDIDINVEIETKDEDQVTSDEILRIVKKVNGKLATGTTHPINYYISRHEYNLDKTDAAYDILNHTWLKIDKTDEADLDLKNYVESFRNSVAKIDLLTGELRRDVQDVETYRTYPTSKIYKLKNLMENKLEEIEDDIMQLSSTKDAIKDLRDMAFDKALKPADIVSYASKNWLPENVTYKLLAKYHYMDFINKLKKFIESKQSIKPKDTEVIKQIGREMWQ